MIRFYELTFLRMVGRGYESPLKRFHGHCDLPKFSEMK